MASTTIRKLDEPTKARLGSDAAHPYARIAAARRRAGHPIFRFDAQTAAIAYSTGAAIATRNVRDFDQCGVKVINPSEA